MAARTSKYPIQLVLMVSTEVGHIIEDVAAREELQKTQVLRSFLHAGMRKAGYTNFTTSDKPTTEAAATAAVDAEGN